MLSDQQHQNNSSKRKISFFDHIFGPTPKRAKTHTSSPNGNRNSMMENGKSSGDGARKNVKPSLDKSRKNEVKERLNAEASNEIRPLAVGTLAMMASALSNQGR